jgi:beta-N-acetylhexosaminidase
MTSAFVCGCSGHALTGEERAFIERVRPWGLILFKRNVDTPEQVRDLVASFRAVLDRPDAPVLMDQEGGRVQRLRPPHWPSYPAAGRFDRLNGIDLERKRHLVRLSARLMAEDLRDLGVSVDCAPVLDIPAEGSHDVVGDRAYARDPETVALLGRAVAEGLLAGGVLPVIKHIPGHGRATADSHLELSSVDTDAATLERIDFRPFRLLADLPMAMTAHVVYRAFDPDAPSTTSATMVRDVIRGRIGFDGLLLTDDLSMQALSGTLRERAQAAVRAGVDILLHCNGDLAEAEQVASAALPLSGRPAERAARALRLVRPPEHLNARHARAELEAALAGAA